MALQNKDRIQTSLTNLQIFERNDEENQKYFSIDSRLDNNESKEENEIRAKVIGALIHRLALVNKEIYNQSSSKITELYNFNIVHTLKNLIKRFSNNFSINLTFAEVVEIFNSLNIGYHKDLMELLFPFLVIETQLELVSKLKFKDNLNNYDQSSDHNVFDFIKHVKREEITSFMYKIQCPLLLLNFIKYRLEKEIKSDRRNSKLSYSLELLYLFENFLTEDYYPVVMGGKVQRI